MIYRNVVAKFVVILIFLGVTAVPASAWGFGWGYSSPNDDTKKLEAIDDRVWVVSDTEMMKCINFNMREQGVEVIVIDITENGDILESYYIVSGEEGASASILTELNNLDGAWEFTPTIKQTKKGLDILQSKKISSGLVMRAIFLYIAVDSDGPKISKIIDKSSWLDNYWPH